MRLYLLPDSFEGGSSIELSGKDYHYLINVLRYKIGTKFLGRDRNGHVYNLSIINIDENSCILNIKDSKLEKTVLPKIKLYQCICKGKKMDLIIRQATEAGISKIIPVNSDFAVAKLEKNNTGKIERWKKITREAIQQSGSIVNTQICSQINIDEIKELSYSDKATDVEEIGLFFHQEKLGTGTIHEYLSTKPTSISLLIGPEGGLSEREIEVLNIKKFKSVYLKTNILRAETAALYAVSAVQTILLESENWMLK